MVMPRCIMHGAEAAHVVAARRFGAPAERLRDAEAEELLRRRVEIGLAPDNKPTQLQLQLSPQPQVLFVFYDLPSRIAVPIGSLNFLEATRKVQALSGDKEGVVVGRDPGRLASSRQNRRSISSICCLPSPFLLNSGRMQLCPMLYAGRCRGSQEAKPAMRPSSRVRKRQAPTLSGRAKTSRSYPSQFTCSRVH